VDELDVRLTQGDKSTNTLKTKVIVYVSSCIVMLIITQTYGI